MDKQRFWKQWKKPVLAAILVLCAGVLFGFVLMRYSAVQKIMEKLLRIVTPFLWGGVIAYILAPVCNWYQRGLRALLGRAMKEKGAERLSHVLSCFAAILTAVVLLVLLLWLLIPQLVESITGLIQSIPGYALILYPKIQPLLDWLGVSQDLNVFDWVVAARTTVTSFLQNTAISSWQALANNLTRTLMSVTKVASNLLVAVIVTFYMLNNRKIFALQGKKLIYALFPDRWGDELLRRLAFADKAFSGFVSGKIVDSAIIGVICFVFCYFMKMPYTALLAVIVGVTNVIPFFGPYIGAIPTTLLIFLESPMKALYFVIFIIILQQFDGNILSPRILSGAVGLSGFWILFSILFFGGLFGVPGMIIGSPLFAVIYSIVRDWVDVRLKKKEMPTGAWHYRENTAQAITTHTEQSGGTKP